MYLAYTFITLLFSGACLADHTPFYKDSRFNRGEYGDYVTHSFQSNPDVKAPVLNIIEPFSKCDDGSYLFLAPRGPAAKAALVILDHSGSPVWASTRDYGQVYNLQMQQYQGESFLTFWAGNDAIGGHGAGKYYMLDKHYNERFKISAANGLDADLHTFELTHDDTALSSIYTKKEVSLADLPGDQDRGWIWDSVFQELNLETGDAIFEWHASEHFDLADSFAPLNAATEDDPWDSWHINSVQKDQHGNYVVSLRFLRTIAYVDGRSGVVLWQLGGARNSFADESGGAATSFLGQHDAQLSRDGRFVTLFDNRADWFADVSGESEGGGNDEASDSSLSLAGSRGKRVALDTARMAARLDAAFALPARDAITSVSQGSFQTLPNGHVLLGYGVNGALAEFGPAGGPPLCAASFEPAAAFGSGAVQSYRNLKFNWTGLPDAPPDLALMDDDDHRGGALYASWNGATEVRSWLFQDAATYDDADVAATAFEDVLSIGKVGFETEVPGIADLALRRFVRVVGVDAEGNALGKSRVIDIGDLATYIEPEELPEAEDDRLLILDINADGSMCYDDRETKVLFVLGMISMLLVLVATCSRKAVSRLTRPVQTAVERTWHSAKLDCAVQTLSAKLIRRDANGIADNAAAASLLDDIDSPDLEKGQGGS